MITKNNILEEYLRMYQNMLPKELQRDEFDFIAENIDLYGDDEDIRKYIDLFVEKLNKVLEKQGAPEKPKATFTGRDVTAEVLKKTGEMEERLQRGKTPDKAFYMTVMAKHKNDRSFKAMDVERGVQVGNLLYAPLIPLGLAF